MENHLRTIARSISWRITATTTTAIWTGLESAIWINLVMTGIYYIHERLWLKIKWKNGVDK
jgi:uncharacterized membrane protein